MRRYRPGYQARRQSSGCCGCLVLLIILAFVFGIPGYFYYRQNPNFIHQIQNQIQNSSNGSNGSNGSNNGSLPATQPAITTAKINQTVTYASVDITIVSVQQSSAFIDDSSSATNGMIRVNIREVAGAKPGNYSYNEVARLILPDKSNVTPLNQQYGFSPAASSTRDNWLDFAVPGSDKINQLTLQLGWQQEAQINIPLTGNANLSAFQAKTATLNKPISYGGVNWTLTTATSSLSSDGRQANAGMHYVILAFNLDNPTAQTSYTSFTGDYMRLKTGDASDRPTSSTLPDATANTTGLSGTVTFLLPNNGNAFTLILLAIPSGIDPHSNVQVNTDFTI